MRNKKSLMKRHGRYTRVVSAVVAILFTLTSVADLPPAQAQAMSAINPFELTTLFRDSLRIPEDIGTIKEVYVPESEKPELQALRGMDPAEMPSVISRLKGPIVFHILDAHANYEAQKNIESMIGQLSTAYGLSLLFLEGGIGQLDPSILKLFDDPAMNKEALDILMKEGEVGGGESFVVNQLTDANSKTNVVPFGIEEPKTYFENLESFNRVMHAQETLRHFRDNLSRAIWTAGSNIFNKNLHTFLKEWVHYQNSSRDLLTHVAALETAAKNYLDIDLHDPRLQADWPQLLRLFKMKEFEHEITWETAAREKEEFVNQLREMGAEQSLIEGVESMQVKEPRRFFESVYAFTGPKGLSFEKYPDFRRHVGITILRSELDAQELYQEMHVLTDRVMDKLAESENEKSLVRLIKDSFLLNKLFELKLQNGDFREITERRQDFDPKTMMLRVNGIYAGNENPSEAEWSSLFDEAMRFYEIANRRDDFILKNIMRVMQDQGSERAVLVTGGFHAERLFRYFQEKEIAYVQIAPRVTRVDADTHEKYIRSITGEGLPFRVDSPILSNSSVKNLNYMTPRALMNSLDGTQGFLELQDGWLGYVEGLVAGQAGSSGAPSSPGAEPAAVRSDLRAQILAMASQDHDDEKITDTAFTNIETWAGEDYSQVHRELLDLLESARSTGDYFEVNNSFTGEVTPGTGGLRGTRGVGPNRINIFTIGKIIEGAARFYSSPEYVEEAKTQGYDPAAAEKGVVLAYDSRVGSYDGETGEPGFLVKRAAEIFAAHGFKVHVIAHPRPTPQLSFLTYTSALFANVIGGGVFTASHNPKGDNGYKPYLYYGGQIPPDYVDAFMSNVHQVQSAADIASIPFDEAVSQGKVEIVDVETVDANYLDAITQPGAGIHVTADGKYDGTIAPYLPHAVYSAMHGTSGELAEKMYDRRGLPKDRFHRVESQYAPDGEFPTAAQPNPEAREIMEDQPAKTAVGLWRTLRDAGDPSADNILVLANDPDADRMAIGEVTSEGRFEVFDGHTAGLLAADYVIGQMIATGKMPQNAALIKTLVTTESLQRLVDYYNKTNEGLNLELFQHMVGFKFSGALLQKFAARAYEQALASGDKDIVDPTGELIPYRDLDLQTRRAILSRYSKASLLMVEETVGFNLDDLVRDKDGLRAADLFTEMKAFYTSQGKTLRSRLNEIYSEIGYAKEVLGAQTFRDREIIENIMSDYRGNPPAEIAGKKVVLTIDYETQKAVAADGRVIFDGSANYRGYVNFAGHEIYTFRHPDGEAFPAENFLTYVLEDGSRFIVRPSGTEPKIKYYALAVADPFEGAAPEVKARVDRTAAVMMREAERHGKLVEAQNRRSLSVTSRQIESAVQLQSEEVKPLHYADDQKAAAAQRDNLSLLIDLLRKDISLSWNGIPAEINEDTISTVKEEFLTPDQRQVLEAAAYSKWIDQGQVFSQAFYEAQILSWSPEIIVYELLKNAVDAHIRANRGGAITYRVLKENGNIVLEVQDNGVGFDGTPAYDTKTDAGLTYYQDFFERRLYGGDRTALGTTSTALKFYGGDLSFVKNTAAQINNPYVTAARVVIPADNINVFVKGQLFNGTARSDLRANEDDFWINASRKGMKEVIDLMRELRSRLANADPDERSRAFLQNKWTNPETGTVTNYPWSLEFQQKIHRFAELSPDDVRTQIETTREMAETLRTYADVASNDPVEQVRKDVDKTMAPIGYAVGVSIELLARTLRENPNVDAKRSIIESLPELAAIYADTITILTEGLKKKEFRSHKNFYGPIQRINAAMLFHMDRSLFDVARDSTVSELRNIAIQTAAASIAKGSLPALTLMQYEGPDGVKKTYASDNTEWIPFNESAKEVLGISGFYRDDSYVLKEVTQQSESILIGLESVIEASQRAERLSGVTPETSSRLKTARAFAVSAIYAFRSDLRLPESDAPLTVPPADGSLSQDERVQEIIRFIRDNFDTFVKQGALAFDVDETILTSQKDGPRSLLAGTKLSSPAAQEMRRVLAELLIAGVRVAIISGNSKTKQVGRIVDPLRDEIVALSGSPSALSNLVFYVNGGATRAAFTTAGEMIDDDAFNGANVIKEEQVLAIADIVKNAAASNFGYSAEEKTEAIEKLTGREDHAKINFDLNWGADWNPHIISDEDFALIAAGETVDAFKFVNGQLEPVRVGGAEGEPLTAAWVEVRGVVRDGAAVKGVGSITVKGIFKLDSKDVRDELVNKINAIPQQDGFKPLGVRKGGSSSVDITSLAADKSTAFEHFISDTLNRETGKKGLNEGLVFYFGDEVYENGNDQRIVEQNRNNGAVLLALNEEEDRGPPQGPRTENTVETRWIGRSPKATEQFLRAILPPSQPAAAAQSTSKRSDLRTIPSNGFLSLDTQVKDAVRSIHEKWDEIMDRGAFVFAVDNTLLTKGATLNDPEFASLRKTLAKLLTYGVRIAIITGNSHVEQLPRFLEPLKSEVDDSVFDQLYLYANGGATKVKFDASTAEVLFSEPYNTAHDIPIANVAPIIETLKEQAKSQFTWSDAESSQVRSTVQTAYPGVTFNTDWNTPDWEPRILTDTDAARILKDGGNLTEPWIEARGPVVDESGSLTHAASFTIRGLYAIPGKDIRNSIIEQIRKKTGDTFLFRAGGASSINITAGVDKATALNDFIETAGLSPEYIYYFGSSFFAGGADQEILDNQTYKLAERGVTTFALNQGVTPLSNDTLWIGRSPKSTAQFLEYASEPALFALSEKFDAEILEKLRDYRNKYLGVISASDFETLDAAANDLQTLFAENAIATREFLLAHPKENGYLGNLRKVLRHAIETKGLKGEQVFLIQVIDVLDRLLTNGQAVTDIEQDIQLLKRKFNSIRNWAVSEPSTPDKLSQNAIDYRDQLEYKVHYRIVQAINYLSLAVPDPQKERVYNDTADFFLELMWDRGDDSLPGGTILPGYYWVRDAAIHYLTNFAVVDSGRTPRAIDRVTEQLAEFTNLRREQVANVVTHLNIGPSGNPANHDLTYASGNALYGARVQRALKMRLHQWYFNKTSSDHSEIVSYFRGVSSEGKNTWKQAFVDAVLIFFEQNHQTKDRKTAQQMQLVIEGVGAILASPDVDPQDKLVFNKILDKKVFRDMLSDANFGIPSRDDILIPLANIIWDVKAEKLRASLDPRTYEAIAKQYQWYIDQSSAGESSPFVLIEAIGNLLGNIVDFPAFRDTLIKTRNLESVHDETRKKFSPSSNPRLAALSGGSSGRALLATMYKMIEIFLRERFPDFSQAAEEQGKFKALVRLFAFLSFIPVNDDGGGTRLLESLTMKAWGIRIIAPGDIVNSMSGLMEWWQSEALNARVKDPDKDLKPVREKLGLPEDSRVSMEQYINFVFDQMAAGEGNFEGKTIPEPQKPAFEEYRKEIVRISRLLDETLINDINNNSVLNPDGLDLVLPGQKLGNLLLLGFIIDQQGYGNNLVNISGVSSGILKFVQVHGLNGIAVPLSRESNVMKVQLTFFREAIEQDYFSHTHQIPGDEVTGYGVFYPQPEEVLSESSILSRDTALITTGLGSVITSLLDYFQTAQVPQSLVRNRRLAGDHASLVFAVNGALIDEESITAFKDGKIDRAGVLATLELFQRFLPGSINMGEIVDVVVGNDWRALFSSSDAGFEDLSRLLGNLERGRQILDQYKLHPENQSQARLQLQGLLKKIAADHDLGFFGPNEVPQSAEDLQKMRELFGIRPEQIVKDFIIQRAKEKPNARTGKPETTLLYDIDRLAEVLSQSLRAHGDVGRVLEDHFRAALEEHSEEFSTLPGFQEIVNPSGTAPGETGAEETPGDEDTKRSDLRVLSENAPGEQVRSTLRELGYDYEDLEPYRAVADSAGRVLDLSLSRQPGLFEGVYDFLYPDRRTTMDALTSQTREVLNLMQTNKQAIAPIVYFDSAVETSETLDQMLDAATFFIEVNQNDAHQVVFVTGNRTDQRQLMGAIAKFLSTKYADSPTKIRSLRNKIRVSRLDEVAGDVSLFLPKGVQTSWVVRQNQESVTEKLAVNKVLKDLSADGPIYDFDSIENSHKASFLQAATLLLLNFHERSPQEIGLVQIGLNAFGQSDVSLLRQLSQQLQRMMDAARTAAIAA